MNEEILKDFFKFLSTDKVCISSKDLQNFEVFITKTDFEDIYENLIEFLNELIYFSVQKLDLNVNIKDEGQINLNANHQLKKYQTSSDRKLTRDRSNPKDSSTSYKMLYKKNLEFNRIKKTEMKRSYRNLIKNKNIDFKINFDLLVQFFKENSKYCEIILNFMVKMQSIIINSQLLIKQKSENNFYRPSRESNRKINRAKIYLNDQDKSVDRSRGNKTDDDCFKCLNIKSIKIKNDKFNKSDLSNHNNHTDNELSKSNIGNKTCLSDNEVLMKTKLNFLKVLKSVTKNIAIKEGKEVTLKIETENLEEKDKIQKVENTDMCNYFENKNDEKSYQGVITFNNNQKDKEKTPTNIVSHDEVKVIVEEQKNEKVCFSTNHIQENKETEYNEKLGDDDNKIQYKKTSDNYDKRKERKNNSNSGCKCNCLIY
jgi:hypothetical protein